MVTSRHPLNAFSVAPPDGLFEYKEAFVEDYEIFQFDLQNKT